MSLFRSFLQTSVCQAINLVALLVTRVVLARAMDPAGYGGFGIGLSLTTLASRLLAFGMVPATQYYGSKEISKGPSFVRTALTLALVISLLSLGILWWATPRYFTAYWASQPTGHLAFLSMIGFMPVIIMSATMSILFIPRGQISRFNVVQLMGGVLMPVLFGFSLLLLTPFAAAVSGQILVWLFVFGFCIWNFRNEMRVGVFDPKLGYQMLLYGIKTWPYVVLCVGTARFALVIGTSRITETQAGLYIVALNVVEGMFGFHGGLGQLLLSKVSREETSSYAHVQLLIRTSLAAVAIMGLGYFLLGRPAFALLFGDAYQGAFSLSIILFIMGAAHAQQSLIVSFMAGIGAPSRNTITVAIEMLALAIAVPVLTSRYGATGLAWAAALAAAIALAVSFHQALRALKCSAVDLLVIRRADISRIAREIKNFTSNGSGEKGPSPATERENFESNL